MRFRCATIPAFRIGDIDMDSIKIVQKIVRCFKNCLFPLRPPGKQAVTDRTKVITISLMQCLTQMIFILAAAPSLNAANC